MKHDIPEALTHLRYLNPELVSKPDGHLRKNTKITTRDLMFVFLMKKIRKYPAGRNRMGLSDLTGIHQ